LNLRESWIVFSNDLANTLRDRRTWLTMVVVPLLLIPALLVAAPLAFESQTRRLAESPPHVAIVGAELAPGLVALVEQDAALRLAAPADPDAALREGSIKAILRIRPAGDQGAGAGEIGEVGVEYHGSSLASEIARARLEAIAAEYAQRLAAIRMRELGIDPSVMTPFRISSRDVAPAAGAGGFFLAMVMPMMLGVWAALGGMYAAIDGVAGEKERGTLEPLLATPASRGSVVAGKYFAVLFTAVVAELIAILGMCAAYLIKPQAVVGASAGAQFSLSLESALVIAAASFLLAALFGAVELSLSTVARTFREAQGYLSPISVAVVVPAVMTQFIDPAEVSPVVFCVPVVNAIFVLKEALLGSIDWSDAALCAGSSIVWIALALRLAARLFNKESVLFRT